MRTRRHFLRTALGGSATLLVAACGGGAQPAPTSAPAKPTSAPAGQASPAAGAQPGAAPAQLKGTKVHLLNWSSFVPEEDSWFKGKLVNDWGKPNGVEMTVELISSNDVQPKVVSALQAGGGPDILQLQWTWAHLYADKLVDLTDLADKAGTDGGGWYEVSKQNNFVDGKWRGMPFAIVGNAIVYRESALKDGAGTDKFPESWDELKQVGPPIRQKTGLFFGQAVAHSFGDPPTFIFPWLWSYGGAETDETGKKIAIKSPETEAALTSFKELFDSSCDQQCLSWDDSSNNRAYAAKQIWATNNGASIYVAALKDDPELAKDSQHHLLPAGPKGQFLLAYPYGFGIPTYVKDPQPARELLRYMLEPKTFGEFMKAGQGYTQAPYKKGEGELWPAVDPKYEPFKPIGNLSKWYGYPAAPSPGATQAGSNYITVDMFAKVIQGDSPQSAMEWAEGELKQAYGL